MYFVLFVLIGLIAGALAWRVTGGGHGMLGDIALGMVGAFLGGWIFTVFGDVAGVDAAFSLLTASIGAVALLGAIRLIAPARI